MAQQLHKHQRTRRPPERHLPGRHLIHHHAQRKQVGAHIQRFSPCLLRRHVGQRPHGRPRSRQVQVARVPPARHQQPYLCQPKVQHLRLRLAIRLRHQEDIRRLDVPVDDPLGMGRRQRIRNLLRHTDDLFRVHRPTRHLFLQRLAFQQLHHHIRLAVLLAHVEDGAYIRMIQRRSSTRLLQKTLPHSRHLIVVMQQLDRHFAAQPFIPCAEDEAHTSAPNPPKDLIRPESLPYLRSHALRFPCSHIHSVCSHIRSVVPVLMALCAQS